MRDLRDYDRVFLVRTHRYAILLCSDLNTREERKRSILLLPSPRYRTINVETGKTWFAYSAPTSPVMFRYFFPWENR